MTGKGMRLLSATLLLAAGGCGETGMMDRELQSITITRASGAPATFSASGTFTEAPLTESPLLVSWFLMGPAIDPPPADYVLVGDPYSPARCVQAPGPPSLTYTVIAIAPVNPNAALSGSMPYQVFEDLVIAHTKTAEGGFIAASVKLACS
jgi:hypothetical protein